MPIDPRMAQPSVPGNMGQALMGQPVPQSAPQPAQGVMAPAPQQALLPQQGQDDRRSNPQVDERERALIANKLGTARIFGDDATAYFRFVQDFKDFAAQLGVDRTKMPNVNDYLAALSQAADYYIRSGRAEQMIEAHQAGIEAPPY